MQFWRDVYRQRNNPKLLQETVTLESFMLNFNGQSMFHLFASNAEMIQIVYDKYMVAKANDTLTVAQYKMPLLILSPDVETQTAIYRCFQQESPRSFELMIRMLSPFHEYCLTQMILRSLPRMLAHESDGVLGFFEQAVYVSPAMREPLLVQWPEDIEDYVFASNTSIITAATLTHELWGTEDPREEEEEEECDNMLDMFGDSDFSIDDAFAGSRVTRAQ